jgi:membrane complex biogenesis BtpA family protein
MKRIDVEKLIANAKPVIGMVHARPLPGAPGWGGSMDAVLERAVRDAEALAEGGVDGIFVENYGDAPFFADTVPAHTIAALTVVVLEVRRATKVPVGVNVLRNDAASALAIAAATSAQFIRVNVHTGMMQTDQGPITGRASETMRQRAVLCPDVAVCADIMVKHAVPTVGMTYEQAASDTWDRGRADVLIVSGSGTGKATSPDAVIAVRNAVPEAKIWIGSGLAASNAAQLFDIADGAIVGTAFQEGGIAGERVERERVKKLMDTIRKGKK